MNVYEIITAEVVKQLEQGTAPWRRPWDATTNGPRNMISKRPYHGLNTFLLLARGFDSPWWLTYKQVTQLGGSVKGERGTTILFWKPIEVADPLAVDGKKTVPYLRYYRVWNVEQVSGDIKIPAAPVREDFDPITRAEAILKGYAHPPALREGGNRAAYSPDYDMIFMPERDAFAGDAGEYYSTYFHEFGHSTGHKSRLDRPGIEGFDHFGSGQYSREELIAEMTSAFLCAEAGISTTLDNSAAYIAGWLRKLGEDPKAVVVAASAAQRAADHILGRGGTKS